MSLSNQYPNRFSQTVLGVTVLDGSSSGRVSEQGDSKMKLRMENNVKYGKTRASIALLAITLEMQPSAVLDEILSV